MHTFVCQISLENAAEVVEYIIREYYHENFEPIISFISQNCVWILPVGHVVIGAEAARRFQNGFTIDPMQLEDAEFGLLDTGSSNDIGVYGTYMLVPDKKSEAVLALRQRVTMLFRKEGDAYRMYHMHTSNEWDELDENEIFPIAIGHQTYQYVQKLILEEGRKEKAPFAFRSERATYYFDLDTVMYIEAVGKSCTVFMTNRTMMIRQPIKAFVEQFPEQFFRIHRSYLVNCRYVVKVERYGVTLLNGTSLPIPEKRYKEVRDGISAWLAKE